MSKQLACDIHISPQVEFELEQLAIDNSVNRDSIVDSLAYAFFETLQHQIERAIKDIGQTIVVGYFTDTDVSMAVIERGSNGALQVYMLSGEEGDRLVDGMKQGTATVDLGWVTINIENRLMKNIFHPETLYFNNEKTGA